MFQSFQYSAQRVIIPRIFAVDSYSAVALRRLSLCVLLETAECRVLFVFMFLCLIVAFSVLTRFVVSDSAYSLSRTCVLILEWFLRT